MIKDQGFLAAEKALAKIAVIERQATGDLPGGRQLLRNSPMRRANGP